MESNFSSIRHHKFNPDLSKIKKNIYIPVVVIIFIVLVLGFLAVRKNSNSSGQSTSSPTSQQYSLQKPRAVDKIEKTFKFPLKDDAGKEVSSITYEIQNAELRDQIIVKGETVTAVKGRTFAIINLKLVNSYNKGVSINTKDYIRLILNGSSEKLAADIHSDPVEVQAISTKYTRIGFPIDSDVKGFTLQVGEITGKKQDINVSFK